MTFVDALQGAVRQPATGGRPNAAVVLLHGYGSDGNDMIGLAPSFASVLPGAVFYSPDAPQAVEGLFAGRRWFDLEGYDPEAFADDSARRAVIMGGLSPSAEASAAKLNIYLDQIMACHELTADRVALLGFSQGTMMSLYVGLRRTEQLAAIVGYAGAMIGADRLAAEIKTRPPVALVHGDADPMVPVGVLADVEKLLASCGVRYESHVIPDLQHEIDFEGETIGAGFLKQKLG